MQHYKKKCNSPSVYIRMDRLKVLWGWMKEIYYTGVFKKEAS